MSLKHVSLLVFSCAVVWSYYPLRPIVQGDMRARVILYVNGDLVTGEDDVTQYTYKAGDKLDFSCDLRNVLHYKQNYYTLIHETNKINITIPIHQMSRSTRAFNYIITAYEFDNTSKVYCTVDQWSQSMLKYTHIVESAPLILILNTAQVSNTSARVVPYYGNITANHTCTATSGFYSRKLINNTYYSVSGTQETITPSDTGIYIFCEYINYKWITSYNPARLIHIRRIENITQHVHNMAPDTEASGDLPLWGLIGICAVVLVCVVLVASYLFLRCRKKKNQFKEDTPALYQNIEFNRDPDQITYAHLDLCQTSGGNIPVATEDSPYAQIIPRTQ